MMDIHFLFQVATGYLMTNSSHPLALPWESEAVFHFLFLLRGWEAAKIPHPIFLTVDVWFFGLGLFTVAVGVGEVNFLRINYVGWVGLDELEC